MTQNFENHVRTVPAFHFVALPILLINVGWSIYRLIRGVTFESVLGVALAIALVLVAFFTRIFALSVQDRVIRLEETMRLERLLPADLKPRIGELSVAQFVSLRFASDGELPALTRKVLDEKLQDRKAIKQMIKQWRPDFLRA